MTSEERCTELHDVATKFKALRDRLLLVEPELTLAVDQRALKSILTDLAWGIENCLVMGNHQIGKSMVDAMGMSSDGKVV